MKDTWPALQSSIGDHPLVGQIRIKGLVGAIELVRDKAKRQFFPSDMAVGMICRKHCLANNLMMRAVRDRRSGRGTGTTIAPRGRGGDCKATNS